MDKKGSKLYNSGIISQESSEAIIQELEKDRETINIYLAENHISQRQINKFKKTLNQEYDENLVLQTEETKDEESDQAENTSQDSIKKIDDDLYQYVKDILNMINTDDQKVNEENMEMIVDQISTILKNQKVEHDRAQIKKFLEVLKKEATAPDKTPEEREKAVKNLTETFFSAGYIGFFTATRGAVAASSVKLGLSAGTMKTVSVQMGLFSWIGGALIYTAQTGLNYRRMKKGEIDKKEFRRRARVGAVAVVGFVIGSATGCGIGFAIGTAIFPGIGSIVGTVIGGLTLGLIGEKVSEKFYSKLDDKMMEARERRLHELSKIISDEKYHEAMNLLRVDYHFNPNLDDLKKAYEQRIKEINDLQNKGKREDLHRFELRKQIMIEAYENATTYLHQQQQKKQSIKGFKRFFQ